MTLRSSEQPRGKIHYYTGQTFDRLPNYEYLYEHTNTRIYEHSYIDQNNYESIVDKDTNVTQSAATLSETRQDTLQTTLYFISQSMKIVARKMRVFLNSYILRVSYSVPFLSQDFLSLLYLTHLLQLYKLYTLITLPLLQWLIRTSIPQYMLQSVKINFVKKKYFI